MKRRYSVVSIAMLYAFTLSAFGQTMIKEPRLSEIKQSGWYAVYIASDQQFAIDIDSVQRKGNVITVWEKITYLSEKQRQKTIDEILNTPYPGVIQPNAYSEWKALNHVMNRIAFDCDNASTMILAVVYYNDEGKALDSVVNRTPIWHPIIPETLGMKLHRFICH